MDGEPHATIPRTRGAGAASRRRRWRSINWVAAVSANATLLSGIAAMTTAVAGVWRPPVPVPVPRVSVTWIGATPAPESTVARPAPTVTALPTSSPHVPGTYQADWSGGMDGWIGSAEWKSVPGALVSDGTAFGGTSQGTDSAHPPYRPSTADYAVSARFKIIGDPQAYLCYAAIQLRVAPDNQGQGTHGYFVGYLQGSGAVIGSFRPSGITSVINHAVYSPAGDWHDYYAAVKDNEISLKIDGSTVLQAADNNYLEPGQVGLESAVCQLQVSSFAVTQL